MRDHLVAEDFKNPSELALHADKLWDAHRVQPGDPSWQQLLSRISLHPVLGEGACLLSDVARLQVLLSPEIDISTNVLALWLIIAVLHVASRKTPEPTGEGGIKQPSHLWFTRISP